MLTDITKDDLQQTILNAFADTTTGVAATSVTTTKQADGNFTIVANFPGSDKAAAAVLSSSPLSNDLFSGDLQLRDVASSMLPAYAQGSPDSDEVSLIQQALARVMPTVSLGGEAGSKVFGPLTQQAVEIFQRAMGLAVDGLVGRHTLRALDQALTDNTRIDHDTPQPQPPPIAAEPGSPIDQIVQIAAKSSIARYYWKGKRGVAPLGYTKGLALVFGRVYCKLRKEQPDPAVQEMARADKNRSSIDAISYYRNIFANAGMINNQDGADTLRHLFVLMMGLGMRESSGAYCEGRDTTNASSVTADTAEAGMFQTSWNAHVANPLMPQLFAQYSASDDSGFLDVFQQHVKCSARDWQTVGSGTGADFQVLSKKNPAFAAEFAAVGLRNIRRHWGPIIHQAAEVRPEADRMLLQVQQTIDTDLAAFSAALL